MQEDQLSKVKLEWDSFMGSQDNIRARADGLGVSDKAWAGVATLLHHTLGEAGGIRSLSQKNWCICIITW